MLFLEFSLTRPPDFFSSATEGEAEVTAFAGVEHEDDGECWKASTPVGEHGDEELDDVDADDADEAMMKKRRMMDRFVFSSTLVYLSQKHRIKVSCISKIICSREPSKLRVKKQVYIACYA